MATTPPGFYDDGQPEVPVVRGARRMSDLLIPDGGSASSLASVPEPNPPPSGYSHEGNSIVSAGPALGRAYDETAGLRANAHQPAPYSLEDLSLATTEAETRWRNRQHDKYASIYADIDEAEHRRRDPMADTIEAQRKDLAYQKLQHPSDATLNDLGVSGEGMSIMEAIPEQLRQHAIAREQQFRGGEAEKQRGFELERAKITAAPKTADSLQRRQLLTEYNDAVQRLNARLANGQETQETYDVKKAKMDRALSLEGDVSAGRGTYSAVSRDPKNQ